MQSDKTAYQAEIFSNRLVKKFRHLSKYAARRGFDAFRLYDRDIPEVPLLIDIYSAGSEPVAAASLYKRPYEKDEAEEDAWLSAMKKACADSLKIKEADIFFKVRGRQRGRAQNGRAQYDRLAARSVKRIVHEGSEKYIVNLSDYLDTGLFLDARLARSFIKSAADGKRVLNLFCYTASFSAAAAKGGALSVDSVDTSRVYLDWARDNFALNDIKGVSHNFIRADALSFLREAHKKKNMWDIVILDPPVFSNSKRTDVVFDQKRDAQKLLENALKLTRGALLFGVKARSVKLESVRGFEVKDLTFQFTDEDFKQRSSGKWFLYSRIM